MVRESLCSVALCGAVVALIGTVGAQQATSPLGYISGAVETGGGPEAGVWVIAETEELETKLAKIARVAVAIDDGDNTDLWIWDLARETLTELTFDEAIDEYPLWTPDSARVVFRSERDGGGLFWKAADGTGQVEQLLENRNIPRPHAWVTDGRLIFDQREGVRAGIGVLTMEGERTVEWLIDSESFETQPALSPDGRWLAYISDETDTFLIYVKPFPNVDDDPWRVSPFFGRTPAWSADGSELFYFGQTDLMVAQIDTELTFRSRTPETLLSFIQRGYKRPGEGTTGRQFDLEPGGDRFIVLKSRATADEGDRFNGLIFVENWFTELKERVPVN